MEELKRILSLNLARDVRRELASVGITGSAAELLVAAGAKDRHAWRADQAKLAALAAARSVLEFEDELDERTKLVAAAFIAVDQCYACSARLPCFANLGKGRRQASDGAAWDAALVAASHELLGYRALKFDIDTDENNKPYLLLSAGGDWCSLPLKAASVDVICEIAGQAVMTAVGKYQRLLFESMDADLVHWCALYNIAVLHQRAQEQPRY